MRDNKTVVRVWAVVYPPSYVAPAGGQELAPENMPTFDLVATGSEMYSAEYAHFDEAGIYRIAIYAADNDGLHAQPYILEVRNGKPIFLPVVLR